MPQLDALTYFSQFIYLVLSFVGVYGLALQFIIPKVVSAQKLRQKLNSVAELTAKLNQGAQDFKPVINDDDVTYVYEGLASENLSSYATPRKPWLICSRMTQLCAGFNQKKLDFYLTLVPANEPGNQIPDFQ